MPHSHTDLVLYKVYWLSRPFGTFPFDNCFQTTRRRISYSVCLLIFLCTTCCSIQYLGPDNIRRTIKVVYTSLANFLSLIVFLKKRYRVMSLYQSLQKVEEELQKEEITWKWNPPPVALYLSQLMFISMLFITALVRYDSSNLQETIFFLISYMFTFPAMLSVISQFTTVLAVLGSLYDRVLDFQDVGKALASISNLYSASERLMSIYGLQILLYTTATFIFIICNFYYEFVYKTEISFEGLTHIAWITITFYPFLDIILSCNRSVTKARKINEVLYERMMEDTTDTLINNELLEFHLTCCRELEFTACGFFTLDNSLICSMIACATTYLVILLQYTNPSSALSGHTLNN